MVQNGFCNDETNIAVCGYDGGDCCVVNVNTNHCVECACHFKESCAAGAHPLVGNGFCDEETNNIDCAYDGGDCCGPDVSCKWLCFFHRIVWNQTKRTCYVNVFRSFIEPPKGPFMYYVSMFSAFFQPTHPPCKWR